MNTKPVIPIFYACDDRFVPFAMVSLTSILENADPERQYEVHILHTDISSARMEQVHRMQRQNVRICFDDVSTYLRSFCDRLPIRDYYTKTTYFRLFIAEMFPDIDKAIYIDSDTVVCKNIAELFDYDLGDHLVGACHEQAMVQVEEYGRYVEKCLGIDRNCYFNAGVLLLNCAAFRREQILLHFTELLGFYDFVVTQDEDYLNLLCKDRVKFLPQCWNVEVFGEIPVQEEEFGILHYIMVSKPWHYRDCRYGQLFWSYAAKTEVYGEIGRILEDYTEEQRTEDSLSCDRLLQTAVKETYREDNYFSRKKRMLCSEDRQKILEKIDLFEREGRFDEDVEDDPPGRAIQPGEVDYLKEKLTTRLSAKASTLAAECYLRSILRKKQLIVKEILGGEHLQNLSTGAVLTCNHFHAMDSFAMQLAFREGGPKKGKLFRIIREGNYTAFPGFYGYLMRNFYTLPLASDFKAKKEFLRAADRLLQEGNFILVYPEQSMWWNYRKPKPLKEGGFYLAAKNNLPVIPCFITMEDSNLSDETGYPVQEYAVHIGAPIYPDETKNPTENTKEMTEKNFALWKEIYESTYHIPLSYKTEER